MREMEFLPGWYPQLRRRKRMIVLQLWATLVIAMGLGLWFLLSRENLARRVADRAVCARQLEQSRSDLKELNMQLKEKERLEADQRIVAKVGMHVEASRLLAKIDQIMPREMTLVQADFDTMETTRQVQTGDTTTPVVTRKLMVHVTGVTPSDADWAGVLAKLSSVPFFQDVRLVGAKDKLDSGHLMREFEVSFAVDLGTGG
jgi:hypothetical protein